MNTSTYREMHLLNEVAKTPDITQRALSRRIGVALGLTNLLLRRLVKKGYIKISGTKRSRLRYLITPKGILEKSRLTYEFVQYSLQLYGRVRHSLREQFSRVAHEGHRRILICGTGELAEIAFLTIQEMGLGFAGVVAESPTHERFLGHPVQPISAVALEAYERAIVAPLRWEATTVDRWVALGIPADRIITLQQSAVPVVSSGLSQSVSAAEYAETP